MNDEIKEKALEKLNELYPDEISIYRRWERCIKMYRSGFWAIPNSIEAALKEFDIDTSIENISRGIQMVNHLIAIGASDKWIRDMLSSTYTPKEYVFMELILKINPRTEQQRLEAARENFVKREYKDTSEFYMRFYGISQETLNEWETAAPDVPATIDPILKPTETRIAAVEELTRRHPDEQGTFHDMDEASEFYEMGCMDAVSAVVQKWIDEHCTDEVRKFLEYFNDFICAGIHIKKIRENFLPTVPGSVRLLLEFFLECSEVWTHE